MPRGQRLEGANNLLLSALAALLLIAVGLVEAAPAADSLPIPPAADRRKAPLPVSPQKDSSSVPRFDFVHGSVPTGSSSKAAPIAKFDSARSANIVGDADSVTTPGGFGPPPAVPSTLPIADVAGQMTQLDIANFMLNDGSGAYKLNEPLLSEFITKKQVGSLLNLPPIPTNAKTPVPTADEWRALQDTIFTLSTTLGSKIPILYGIDTIHGANYVFNATLFPQPINMAATFNETVASDAGRVGGLETRYAGIPWVFSPVLGLAVQPSWSRIYETFGEDPFLVNLMGVAIVRGLQQPPSAAMNEPTWTHTVAACLKHFIGYTNVRTGRDRTPSNIPMNELLQYYAPPFQGAITYGGALSIMENYIELNGRPVVMSDLLLNFLLRNQFRFNGLLVTDYNEIFNLADFHMASENFTEAIFDALNHTSIDMGMIGAGANTAFPSFSDTIVEHYLNARLDETRLRLSGGRVLALKAALGLISADMVAGIKPSSPVPKNTTGCVFACDEHRKAALDAARQSVTLLQNNNNFLPLNPQTIRSIAVVGAACDSVPMMAGGWTIAWQGTYDKTAFPYGSTIRQELTAAFPNATVSYNVGCNANQTDDFVCYPSDVAASIAMAKAADVVIACVGERPYAEQPGDIDDLTLPGGQIPFIQQIVAANPNTVLVLVEGRPRILQNLPAIVPAVVHLYLPGPAGGLAAVEVLAGITNPSGRLPLTYPLTLNNAPIQYWRKYSANHFNDYTVQWPFGTGLSYSRVAYSDLSCGIDLFNQQYECTIIVSARGTIATLHTLIVYATQQWRPITPEVQRVVAVKKLHLPARNYFTIVSLVIPFGNVSYHDEYNCQWGSSAPITFSTEYQSAFNVTTQQQTTVQGYAYFLTTCSDWGRQFQQQTGNNIVIPITPAEPVRASTSAYFLASVVCFGAGIVATVIIITWLRKRGNQQAGSLLAPSAL